MDFINTRTEKSSPTSPEVPFLQVEDEGGGTNYLKDCETGRQRIIGSEMRKGERIVA